MISGSTSIRVRYPDTDKMAVVWHGVYVEYCETGRTELLRSIGMPNSSLEERGFLLPVLSVELLLKSPARYDDLLSVTATIETLPSPRFNITYRIERGEELLASARTTHAFVSAETWKPVRPPKDFVALLESLFNS